MIAKKESRRAVAAKSREELAKQKVLYETYISQIALAAEKIDGNAFGEARRLLDEYKSSPLRQWEWRRLSYVCNQSSASFDCGNQPVDAVAFSPDGKEFVTAGQDGVVRIWTTTLSENPKDVPKPRTFSHTALGQRVPVRAVAWANTVIGGQAVSLIATVGERGSVHLWKADGSPFKSLAGHSPSEAVTSAVFSVSGPHKWLVTGSEDKTAVVWDLARPGQMKPLRAHSGAVWDVAVTDDQQQIATAGQDGKIFLWNVAGASDAYTITQDKELAGFHDGPVYSIAFSPDGTRAVSGGRDNRILVWKVNEAKTVDIKGRLNGTPELQPNWLVLRGHTAAVRCVRFSPDKKGNRILSCGDDNTVCLWNSHTGVLERTLRGHGSFVRSCAFAPADYQLRSDDTTDRLVLSGSHDTTSKLWRTAGYDDVRIYRAKELQRHDDQVLATVYGPSGKLIATASKDRTIRLWDVSRPGKPTFRELKEGHDFLSTSARFFRKGRFAGRRFVTSGMDGTVRIWGVDSGTQLADLKGAGSSGAIALSPDEAELAAGGKEQKDADGKLSYPILLWKTADLLNKQSTPRRLFKHEAQVTALAYSLDGTALVSGDSDGFCFAWHRTAQGWDDPQPVNGRLNVPSHSKRINSIVFLDDRHVATASNDRTISVWELGAGVERHRISLADSVIAMDVSPDGRRLVVTTSRADEAGEFTSSSTQPRNPRTKEKKQPPDSVLQTYTSEGKPLEKSVVRRGQSVRCGFHPTAAGCSRWPTAAACTNGPPAASLAFARRLPL